MYDDVDKTGFALKLVDEGKAYFLSRPRRFGKSLFLDTLAELFAGNEPLFRGLFIQDRWDWTIRYPVIRLSFGGGIVSGGGIRSKGKAVRAKCLRYISAPPVCRHRLRAARAGAAPKGTGCGVAPSTLNVREGR